MGCHRRKTLGAATLRRFLGLGVLWIVPIMAAAATIEEPIEMLYDGGVQGKWVDAGWARRDTDVGKPAHVDFSNHSGWTLVRHGLYGKFTAVRLHMKAPPSFGFFLDMQLGAEVEEKFPRVPLTAEMMSAEGDGTVQVRVPMTALNPHNVYFDRVTLHANRAVASSFVTIDKYALLGEGANPTGALSAADNVAYRRASAQIDCTRPTHSINPLIYGIAYNQRRNGFHQWKLGATSRRWGGNTSTRYNWQLGNAWNTANDWFFLNVNFTNIPDYSWTEFFDENKQHGVSAAMTLPMLGWVAKDTRSYSYPVSVYGPQSVTTGPTNDIGNGLRPNGGKIVGSDPRRTSMAITPDWVGTWVRSMRRYDDTHRSIAMYILDNEPSLWNSTHRDVHPEPVGYDELLKRTIEFGSQVRRSDPGALIAGPAEWGWPAYFFSAKDADSGFSNKPDRRAHGDVPYLAWYLRQLREHEERTGERLLNILDVHYYPQSTGTFGSTEHTDAASNERRLRSTRSLWDPTYRDESWINERIRLLPRLRSLVAENYPGLDISIGEYNFGGEKHISGGLALAEVLGRFGQEGIHSAYYWTFPPDNSPAFQAFRAYRNYDGQGAHFLDRSVSTSGDKIISLFASQNHAGDKLVTVVLNMDSHEGSDTTIDLVGCGEISGGRTFQYTGLEAGIRKLSDKVNTQTRTSVRDRLPPYSITIYEMSINRSRR